MFRRNLVPSSSGSRGMAIVAYSHAYAALGYSPMPQLNSWRTYVKSYRKQCHTRQNIVKTGNEKSILLYFDNINLWSTISTAFVLTILWPAYVMKLEKLKQHSSYSSKISIKRKARKCLHVNILLSLEQLITRNGACEMYQSVHTYSPPINIKTNDL